ncbi:hypothetical protein E3N88_15115 [Mikania micrantha]|uniref:Uncharacterized protein n=1 Tax=Mikania micrantha TaxID=192012 RepID=A0A5N6NXP8_9ASTR|nr:hypothetical protein E3N88_15115 [Mikania micrantha]
MSVEYDAIRRMTGRKKAIRRMSGRKKAIRRMKSRAKALIPLCRTNEELGNNLIPMEIYPTASGIVRNPIPGFSNRNQQQPW